MKLRFSPLNLECMTSFGGATELYIRLLDFGLKVDVPLSPWYSRMSRAVRMRRLAAICLIVLAWAAQAQVPPGRCWGSLAEVSEYDGVEALENP